MTFSTRNNPRLAQSGTALTSLGAVGGARGVSAGALRILVEFLTTYDKQNLQSLENDLASIDHASAVSVAAEQKRQERLTTVKKRLVEVESLSRGRLNTQLRSDLKKIEALESSRSKANQARGAAERTTFNQLAKNNGLTKSEIDLLGQRRQLVKEHATLVDRNTKGEETQARLAKQRVQTETQLNKLQIGRQAIGAKLGGLAIGALGGIVGGAVLGIGFQLAQQALEQLGDKVQDIIDPARHAREAIKDLGDEVLTLAKNSNLTLFEAATEKARQLGVSTDHTAVSLLEQFAAQSKVNDSIDEYAKFIEAGLHPDSLKQQAIQKLTDSLIKQAEAQGNVQKKNVEHRGTVAFTTLETDQQFYLNQATELYNKLIGDNTSLIDANAKSREDLAGATALARVAQDALNDAIQRQSDKAVAPINRKLENLELTPSARTKSLEAAIERAQNSTGDGGARARALRDIAEERSIILLRQRLRLLGANINLEKYSGKFLLEAINAKVAALQKEGDAQSRLNHLLDLQYRMSQTIRRNQGESIGDFVERRAQENRGLLAEQADLRRQDLIDSINEKRDAVQDEVALAELAQRKEDALRKEGSNNRLKLLQKELEASRKADQKALQAKRKSLEAEKKAIEDKYKDAIKFANQAAIEETLAAIRGAKNLQDLATISGRMAGLERAKATIQGLVKGFGLPDFVAAPFLEKINAALESYGAAEEAFLRNLVHIPGKGPIKFASGGIMQLNNSHSPFGQNVRLGEGGTELGVILSNRVTQALKDNSPGVGQVGPFYMQERDPLADRYFLKRTVKEAISEALR